MRAGVELRPKTEAEQGAAPDAFWAHPVDRAFEKLATTPAGLNSQEAELRLATSGPNHLHEAKRAGSLALLAAQFKSPITLVLVGASILSFGLGDITNASIILGIVLASALLGFWQERGATQAVAKLLDLVRVRAAVVRNGSEEDIPVEDVVPGDVVRLHAGDVIPADGLILESKDLFVDEASLTGETFPAEKQSGVLPAATPLAARTNALFMGTHVVSGTATAVVVATGLATEFGRISHHLRLRPPETDFERGVRRLGHLLLEITLFLVLALFAVNVTFHRPVLDSLLFSLALAVGLTPQLLPAIISVNLSHGARRMARQRVIVKRLASIENFGSMDVLCSDKTGTLTEGRMELEATLAADGTPSERTLLYATLNARLQTGFSNPIDAALAQAWGNRPLEAEKLDEIPYDFVRKRLSILATHDGHHVLVAKGAVAPLLGACATAELANGTTIPLDSVRKDIESKYAELSGRGLRVLGVAIKDVGSATRVRKDDESDLSFLGFVALSDPPKPGARDLLERLASLGVSLRIVTGDNRFVALHTAAAVGLADPHVVTGSELRETGDEALVRRVETANVFAEVEPNQKERLILALRKAGHVVGFLGDGINDASALHVADVGISVDDAVDVAKEAADIVLLEKDLGVLAAGIQEGRATFANTLKYVFMATSANFGNMFSMAGASLFLPFLPLLPRQILLMNLLTDLPEMTIASDTVDPESVERPRRWDIRFIRRFMMVFGLLSSVFDFMTFGVLLLLFRLSESAFRTGWFLESVASAALIVLVMRTRRAAVRSRPSATLLTATLAVVAATFAIPWTPLGRLFGFQPLPLAFLPLIGAIVILYFAAAELAKRLFYRHAV
ncbi:MAG: magnesium-translocating P-type ATPase [Thermotogota bacterium]